MKKRMRKVQIIAIVLSTLMLLNIPLPAFAEAAVENAIEEAQNQPVLMTDKLTETETYWQNADGSITYEESLTPIRYQDEKGNWHDIVNDIVQVDKSEESKDAFKNDSYDYRSESSKAWVLLDENIRNSAPIKLQFGAYTLTSRPVWGNLPIPDNTDESLQEKADPIATETPQLADGTLEDTEGDEQEGTEEQPTPSPTLHVETAPQSVKQNQAVKSEELESRISFIEKQKEQEEGAQRQRVPAANTDTEADPYTYSSEKEYEAVEYSNVFGAGTTLRLTPTNEGYKEDIILFERPEQASFSFELNVTGLVLELDENNVVWMKDAETEEVIGFLPQPYMEDSSILEEGVNDSTDIVVTLEEKENGRYLYTLTPSAEWLDAETTVYPVKIDPSASISGSNQKDKDVTDTGKPYTNAYQYLRVGRDTDGHKYRAYIQFTLPSNLTGSYVTAATLNTYQTYSGTSSPTFAVHRVNGSWTSAGITWSNQPSFSSGSYASQAVSGVKNYTWNMRTMVQEWANGTANNGLVIKATDETPKRYKRFASSDSASNKPSLSITYYPVNLTINASGTSGSINSSQGSINVSWVAPPSGVTAKVVLDGKEYSPNNANGANTHKFSGVSSYVSHKVKVRFTGTNFDRSTAEKTIKLEDRTPPIFNTTSEVSVVDGQLNVKMNPAVKPNSIQSVAFPTWTSNDGQDDIKWYAPAHNGNGDWSYTVDIGTHGNQTGVYNVHCYARTAEGTYAAFALCDFNFAELTEYSGRLFAPPNGDQPVAVKVTVKKISATKFTVTAVGVQESESIAEHQIYWQEVDSEEKHYLPAITGDVKQGMISKSYDIKESGMPSGATIRLYASAKDKFGNFTPAGYLLGTVDIPNYVSPQAPQLLAQSGTRTYLGGEAPSFAVKDHIQIIWKVEKGTGSNYDVGTIQYSFDKQNWITVSVDDWLNKGEGYTIKENGIEISVADKSDGIIPLYVRALDNNEIAEERLAGPESTIQILKDAAAPVLQITYPQSVQEIEGIPQWDISNPVLIDQIQEDSLEMIKVEAGQYIDLLGQDVIPIYQVITEIPGETVTNETLPLHVLLGSCGLHDAKYQLRITATDKAGNESVYTQDFYLMTSMTYEAKGIELSSTDVNDTPLRIKLNTVPKTITFQEDPVMDADKEYRFITKLLRGEGIDVTVDGTTRTIQIDALGDLAPGMPKPFYLIVEQMETGERMYSSPAFKDGTQDTLVYRADTSTEIEKRFEGTLSEGGPGIIDRIRITGTQETMDGDIIYTVSFYDNNDQLIEQKTVQGTVGAISPEGIAYKYKIDAVIENTANSYEAIRVVHETTYIGIATELQNELVAPVAKVSAIPQVNYTTRLRWEASPTENIVYDVYRNTQDSFEGAALLASNLPTTYYYDHDWVDNKEFFYWVVAKKSFAAEGETPAYASSAADKIIGATCYYGEEGGLPQKQVYQYTYDSTPDSVNYGRLIDVRTTCVQTNSVIETNESGSENVTSLPYQTVISESYEYTDTEEGRTFAAKVPSNTSASGIRTYTFQMDAQGRVTGTIDALSNHSEITYMTHTSGAPTALNEGTVNVVETTVTPYIGEQNTGATTYYTDANLHGVLTRLIQPGDRITNRSEYSEAVLKPGKITSYADADHQKPLVYDITYNTNGTVAKSIAPNGLRTEYTYIENENGLTDWVASERVYQNSNNALLDRREYTYDAKGNLLTQKVAVSNPASGEWNHRCTTHTYYANGLIQSTVEWNGKKTGYTYDERGNLILQKLNNRDSLASSYTYDIRNNMKTESVHRGSKKLTKTYVHDEIGRIREVLYADGQREINDYNRSGLLVSKVIVGAPASDGGTTQAKRSKYVYDNLDRVVSMTDPEGNVTKTIYGVTGNATVVTTNIMAREDSESVVRSTVAETAFDGSYSSEKSGTLGEKTYYDYQGNETKTVQLYKDAEGWKETRAMHSETDTQGRVIRQWNEVTRTESGKLAEEDYTEVRTDYDALGNPIRQWTLASKNGDTKQYSVKQYTYDLLGRVLSVRERTGLVPYSNANIGEQASDIVTTYTYDAIQSDGVSMDTQVQAGGKQTNTYYNSLGQVVKEVQTGAGADAPTITKEYQYDAYGRQVKMLEQGVVRYQYGYDDYDRIIKQTTGSASENNVHETQLTYDHFSRRAAMKDIVDNVEILTTWKYDKNDQAIQLLQDGKVVFYAYDEAGDMTAMQYGANGNIRTIQYDLDSMGRLTAIRSGTQTLTEEAEGVVQTNDVKTVKTYGYDAIGDLTSTMEYAEFDTKADGQGLAVTGTFTYDDAGRPLTTVYAQNDVQKEKYTMKYDNKGNVVSETYIDSYADSFTSNKTITTIRGYQYDAVGRMTENTVTKREGDTQTGQKTIGYTYDRIGNRLTETNSQTYDNGSSNATKTYTYDGLDRLLKVTENGKVTTNVGEQSYNQILAEYGYDTYGNQTSQKVYELDIMNANSKLTAEIRHTYDAANQLIETEEKKQGQDWKTMTVNRYNGEGQRVRKIEDGMADGDFTRYFYMSGALAFSTNSDPNYISDENILDLNGKVVAARRSFAQLQEGREESQYWTFHYDARGSVTNVVGANNTGALYRVENNVYDAFGQDEKPETPQTQIKNEVKFTGAVQDNSGLYYMGSRHYDPSTGRYIQQDVLQGDPYSPWTQNRYAYCGGNPSSYIDPTGHLLGALFGGLFGGLWGGIKSALNGDGFWKGAASGAAKGFITGAGIDIALATGGVGIPLAISAVGGAIGGATGDVIEQVFDIDAGRRASIDGWQILGAGFAGAAEGLLGYGIGVYGGGRHIVEGTWAQRFSSDLGLVQSGKDLAEVVISAAAEETSAVILEEASGARRKPIVTRNRNTKKKTIHASSTKQALEVVNNSNGAIRDSDKVNLGNSCHITVGMIRPGSGQYRHPSTWFSPTNPYRWC